MGMSSFIGDFDIVQTNVKESNKKSVEDGRGEISYLLVNRLQHTCYGQVILQFNSNLLVCQGLEH